ncbi:hypothetical protein JS528_09620 [Bifidobacterium sp. MA2]|uniref:Uncharacterized protein n=1 Tax=Bifidobacterium santillanense TaxID=2809028 RepID=A0ABS5USG2_9BIFI|nr:hypothetical protein [Bifidobacterium santillanense]MBT1173593.1 hypothetical protein [Bifidobacterium santillanense]
MADKLNDYKAITLRCDTASDYMPQIAAVTGDRNGRVVRAVLTNGGKDVDPEGITARLLYDPEPDNPKVFGDRITMTPVTGAATATFEAPIPSSAIQSTGKKTLGLQFTQNDGKANESTVVTRPFTLYVESGVLKVTSGDAAGEFEEAVRRAEAARDQAEVSAANAADSEKLAAQHLADIGTSKEEAAASAAAALASQNAAKASQDAAKTSETNAKASEAAAATSASNAADSAAAALASQNAAKASEDAAAASAAAAKTSETNAKASETAAKTSETNAKASETAAAESAAQAAASDAQAGRYADQAEESATDAASSATTATQAADSATASKTAAKASEDAAAASAAEAKAAVDGFGLVVDQTNTVAPGTKANVALTKTGHTYHATFDIPQGERGENTAAISSITLEYTPGTGTPDVHVEAGGTPTDRTLKFVMSNLEGADGHTPLVKIGTVTTLDPGSKVTVTGTTDDNGDVTFDFGIPRGADGSNATVTAGNGITVTDGQVSAKAKPTGALDVSTEGIGVNVDDTTVKIVDNKLTALGGAHIINATFAVADFDDNLTATKAITGLQAVNLVSPATTSVDNVETYINANPVIQDHTDNPDVPDGSLRMICTNEPDGPITIRIATMKEN